MRQLCGHKRMPKKFGSNQERIGGTSFTEKPHWTEMKNNFWGIILGLGQERLGIFEQHMSRRNYENYLGILGVTEI